MRTLTLSLALIALALPLGACQNTADGFGKDLERAGQTIQKKV